MVTKSPCIPDMLPIHGLDWEKLVPFISKAGMALAHYDGTLDGIINAAVLLSPITEQEAILSSRIEGTVATLVEVLGQEAGEEFDDFKRGSIHEIINYRQALLIAENYLKERPITLQLIRELHGMLMTDVRGGDKTPGQFRSEQNHIGKQGTPIEQARFIPPSPVTMQSALDNLQSFMNSDYNDPLVQLAIIHAQFEIIHPFNDGNGRVGRMLIPMFLYRKGVLQRPMFYLSEYLEEHDTEYRDRLLNITESGDWHSWIEFFLKAIHIQADKNKQKARDIHTLYERMKIEFAKATRSQFSVAALDTFFKRPICNSSDFHRSSGIKSKDTANGMLRSLTEAKLICQISVGSGRRPSRYALPELINIAEGKQVFVKQQQKTK